MGKHKAVYNWRALRKAIGRGSHALAVALAVVPLAEVAFAVVAFAVVALAVVALAIVAIAVAGMHPLPVG